MSLSDIGAIGSFVSAIAVVASVVYLALQIRQASVNQRGTMHQMRAALSADIMLRIAESDMSAAFRAGLTGSPDITEAQFWQFFYAASAIMRTTENAFGQYEDGLVSEAHLASAKASARSFLMYPGYAALWTATRIGREDKFREFMDALLAETAAPTGGDTFRSWKALLAR
jgi:hypothetical protein